MNFTRYIYSLTLLLTFGLLFGQKNKGSDITGPTVSNLPSAVSKTFFTGTPEMPVKLDNAHYEQKKKNIPYFLSSKSIGLNNSITGTLKNIQTVLLSADASQKILTAF